MSDFKFNTNPFINPLEGAMENPFDGVFQPPQPEGMGLGMNLAWINSWARAYVFSNLMYNASMPERTTGNSPWTHKQGLITTNSTTDKFRFVLSDQRKYLVGNKGTYTVLNPSRAKIAIGIWNTPPDAAFTDAAEFTFDEQATSGNVLALWVMGSLTNENGNVAVILPGHKESWLSGNIWNKQFLSFYNDMNLPLVRAMDWNNGSGNIEMNWEDRSHVGYPTLMSPFGNCPIVPYEFYCDLSKRIRAEFWMCIPYRATDAYVAELGKFFAANYPSRKKLWVEYGNEIWNFANPWCSGSRWVETLRHTRYVASVDAAAGIMTVSGHGLDTGDRIVSYSSANDNALRLNVPWQLSLGSGSYVKVLSPDTFEVYSNSSLTDKFVLPIGKTDHVYNRDIEPGKVNNQHLHYSERLLAIWDILESKMSAKRLNRIVASQSAATSVTAARVAVPGIKERGDVLAVAPYFDGVWWGVTATGTSGQIQPGVWIARSETVHIAVYPTASNFTPTVEDVISGNGAVSKQTLAYNAGGNGYTQALPITGLKNGSTYRVMCVFVEGPLKRLLEMVVPVDLTPVTVTAEPTYVDQAMSQELSVENNTNAYINHTAIIAAAGGSLEKLKVMAYEGGVHYHHSCPPVLNTWVNGYLESEEFSGVTYRYLMQLASKGMTQFCHYADSLGTRFKIADGFHDVGDNRYQVFKNLKGFALKLQRLPLVDLTLANIEDKQVLPYLVYEYPNIPGATYTVLGGDSNGNFTFVDNKLMFVNEKGVDWNKPRGLSLDIHVRDANLSASANLKFSLGKAWYEADALFAWSPKGTLNTEAIIPDLGNVIPLTGGTGASISDDLWKFNMNAVYSASNGLLSGISLSKPVLFATVFDFDGMREWYRFLNRVGSGNFLATYMEDAAKVTIYSWLNGAGPSLPMCTALPTGKHVFWVFYDPATVTFYAGFDRTVFSTAVVDKKASKLGTNLVVGGDGPTSLKSKAKHGCMQVLNRSGMTLDDAKLIIDKMALHHGI